jgi:hypothetical protein
MAYGCSDFQKRLGALFQPVQPYHQAIEPAISRPRRIVVQSEPFRHRRNDEYVAGNGRRRNKVWTFDLDAGVTMTKLLVAASCSSSTLQISDRSSESLNFFRTTAAGVGEGRVAHEWDVLRSSYGDGFPSALCFVAAVAFWL